MSEVRRAEEEGEGKRREKKQRIGTGRRGRYKKEKVRTKSL
jgi:hypothetical protein